MLKCLSISFHLLLESAKKLGSVGVELSFPRLCRAVFHDPKYTLGGFDETGVVRDHDHSAVVVVDRVAKSVDGLDVQLLGHRTKN